MSSIVWQKKHGAHHGRDMLVFRMVQPCNLCEQEQVCLGFDSSEDEYGAIWICQTCALAGFRNEWLPLDPAMARSQRQGKAEDE